MLDTQDINVGYSVECYGIDGVARSNLILNASLIDICVVVVVAIVVIVVVVVSFLVFFFFVMISVCE